MGYTQTNKNTLFNYYSKREITTEIAPIGETIKIFPTKGTAQGNVLSPMLWNCVVNQIGFIMEKHNLGGCLFADDVVIAANGHNLNNITTSIQTALQEIESWAIEEGLKFNIGKSHSILFQYDNTEFPPHQLMLNGQILKNQNSTKYLGVTLNNKLKWTEHFNAVFNGAKRDITIINKALSKTQGPSPKLTHWIYTGIVRPKISYAAHIWCGGISNHVLGIKSRQIQRWALTKLGPIRQNTPTAGLEIITKTMPLHIHLQEISLRTMHNFLAKNINIKPSPKGHLSRWLQNNGKIHSISIKTE
jgi:hypothetical protein